MASEVLGLELRDDREARMVRLHDRAAREDLPTYEEAEARIAELEARLRTLEGAPKPPDAP